MAFAGIGISISPPIPAILWPDHSGPAGPEWSVLDGVLDLRAGLLHVAVEPVTAAPGAQATAAGEPAGGPLEAAFDRFGFVRELLADTHGAALSAGAAADTLGAGWPASGSAGAVPDCRGAARRPNRRGRSPRPSSWLGLRPAGAVPLPAGAPLPA